VGREVTDNPYHINIVRGPLTRNLANQFEDIRDEMVLAVNDMIPLQKDGALLSQMLFDQGRYLS
jgi:hypothetical protein